MNPPIPPIPTAKTPNKTTFISLHNMLNTAPNTQATTWLWSTTPNKNSEKAKDSEGKINLYSNKPYSTLHKL